VASLSRVPQIHYREYTSLVARVLKADIQMLVSKCCQPSTDSAATSADHIIMAVGHLLSLVRRRGTHAL